MYSYYYFNIGGANKMKKSILTSILMILALILCASMVSAAVTLQGTYDDDNPNFGNANQEASNPRADDESDENIYIDSASLVLVSDVATSVDVTSISYTYTYGFSQTDLNLSANALPTGITNTTSGTLVLHGRVPEELDSVERDDDDSDYLEPKAFHVADAVVTFSDSSTLTIPVYMQRENKLVFKSSRVYLSVNDGDEDRINNDDNTEDIKPGDDINIKIEVENDYSSSDNVEMDDVTARVLLDDNTDNSWDWDEIDEEADFGSVQEGEEEDETVEFTVDKDVDDYNDYKMYVYLTGEDENGAKHGAKILIKFVIDRETYEFLIKKAELSSDTLTCSRNAAINVRIDSLGRRGDDEVSLYISNTDLNLNFKKENIDMGGYGDSDDSYSRTVQIPVSDDVAAGTYTIRVRAFYSGDEDDGALADLKDADLVINDCPLTTSDSDDSADDSGADDSADDSGADDSADDFDSGIPDYILDEFGVTSSVETSFTSSPIYTAILVIAIVVALASTALLIVLLVKRGS
jgi:hypothetical protein